MRVRAWLPVALAGIVCALGSASAQAESETAVESVAGYQINRVNDTKNLYPCRMVRGYADPDDNNAANALAFGQVEGNFIVSLVYEHWKWENGKTYKAGLSVDKKLIDANAPWLGNGTNLAVKVPNEHLPKFDTGKKVILKFRDGTADFDLTGFKPAFEALARCNEAARSGAVAAKPSPPPLPAVPAPAPEAAPAAALPSENRAVVYLFALYDRWAFDACDVSTTAKQRGALDAKLAALKPEMAAIESDLQTKVQGDPDRCPPSAVLEKQLKLLLDESPEDFLAKMDEKAVQEFRGIVRPILERLRPASPNATPAEAAKGPLPSEPRIAAYLMGVSLQDAIGRCDIATTAKQRAGLDAKVAALTSEMAEVEATARKVAAQNPCPSGETDSEDLQAALKLLLDKTPEAFTIAWDERKAGAATRTAKEIVKEMRPAPVEPSQARMSAYLWGLLLKDKIAECDLPTTAKQRAGLEAKLAGMQPEMAPFEALLREQIKGKVEGCPRPDKLSDMQATLALFVENEPDAFAAEMDKRNAARKESAPKP